MRQRCLYICSDMASATAISVKTNMELLVPKISKDSLTEDQLRIHERLGSKPFGIKLAKAVLEKLKDRRTKVNGLYYSGRGYCGIGLFVDKYQRPVMQTVFNGAAALPIIARFNSDDNDFLSWLAQENEQSMSLYGGQFHGRILSRARLMYYLKDDFNPAFDHDIFPMGGIPEAWLI